MPWILVTRAAKGRELTWEEMDGNLVYLRDLVVAAAPSAAAAAASATAAAGSASAAATSAANASVSAVTASNAATTATTQAGIATTGATTATTQAGIATTQAGIATTQATASGVNAVAAAASAASAAASAGTATSQAGLAQIYAAAAASVAQQDLSGVTAAKLHSSPNAVTAMCLYDVSKDSDGGAWVERVTNTSWFQEALNGAYLPGGFASEMDARDYLGSYQAASIVTGDSSNFAGGVGSWVATAAHGAASTPGGRLRLTQIGALGTVACFALAMTTVVGQRYQVQIDYTAANISSQNLFLGANTVNNAAGTQSLNMGSALGTRRLSFVAAATTTYLILQGSTAWPTNGYVEVDNITVKPVSFADPAGAWYQSSADGKFYRLWKNRVAYFNDLTNAAWIKTNATVTPRSSGDGVGDKVVESAGGSVSHALGQSCLVAGVINTLTYRVKAGERTQIGVSLSGLAVVYLDLSTQSVVSNAGGLGVAWAASGVAGYWDVSVTGTPTGSTATIYPAVAGTAVYVGDGASGVYVAQVQAEVGSSFTGWEAKTGAETGQTETFRGSKAKFPRLAAIVLEALSLTVYDLTEPGRPMWGRWSLTGMIAAVTGVTAVAGRLIVSSTSGLVWFDLAGDLGRFQQSGNDRAFPLTARSNPGGSLSPRSPLSLIVSNTVNAVAACVLPDAPVDPVTGLQVPTIACFTGAGISIIQNDGTVRNSSSTAAFTGGQISKDMLFALRTSDLTALWYAAKPASLGAAFGINQIAGSAAPGFTDATGNAGFAQFVRTTVAARQGARLALMRLNETTPTQSLVAQISSTYNTGWWCGDIRRVWCADTVAGTVSAANLVANGDFSGGSTGWTTYATGGNVITIGSGSVRFQATGADAATVTNTGGTALSVGRWCSVSFEVLSGSSGTLKVLPLGAAGEIQFSCTPGVKTFSTYGQSAQQLYISRVVGQTADAYITNFVVSEVIADRCYKAKPATIVGTLARTAVASGAQLVAYSGFSASNYIQEAYSADLDFGTGAWTCSAWVNIPATDLRLGSSPLAFFPEVSAELNTNVTFDAGTTGWTAANGTLSNPSGRIRVDETAASEGRIRYSMAGVVAGDYYKVELDLLSSNGSGSVGFEGGARVNNLTGIVGTRKVTYVKAHTSGTLQLSISTNAGTGSGHIEADNISIKKVGPSTLLDRSAASGASVRLGLWPDGTLSVIASDGTTTRTVTTTASYNTGQRIKARASYTTDGTLSISVIGRVVAQTFGSPLLTMNNGSAVTTIGNSRALDAPFPGDICLVKWGATVPTQEQMLWMYEQEKQMFQAGAQVTLPDSGSLVDVAYDDLYDRITVVSAANESNWTGLVRTSTAAVPAGAYTKAARGSGVKLLARSTTNLGVDVTIPSQNLKEELLRRAEDLRRARVPVTFDYVGGFTADVTNGTTALASVTGLSVPAGVNLRGVTVTGTGIPASTVITDIVGSTVYISKPATATNTGVSISMLEFPLPTGYEAEGVATAGALKQEGATKDWTRAFDGFVERPTFPSMSPPGPTTWVQVRARRTA